MKKETRVGESGRDRKPLYPRVGWGMGRGEKRDRGGRESNSWRTGKGRHRYAALDQAAWSLDES